MRLAPVGGRPTSAAALEARLHVLEAERSVSRKELAAVGRDAMKGLLLRPSLRLVLAELIGCWGQHMIRDKILVWPSNEYLIRRTGLSERTVRYAIAELVELQLIVAKDSANHKRFAIKNRAGTVVDIYGFDLTPLYMRHGEFMGLIVAQDARREARARLFDGVTICRRAIEEALAALSEQFPAMALSQICIHIRDKFEDLKRRTPRRNLTSSEHVLTPLVAEWRSLRQTVEEAYYQAASGGKLCPHIETDPINDESARLKQEASNEAEFVEDYSPDRAGEVVALVVEACPSLSSYTEVPKTETDLVAAGRYLRSSLGAHGTVWEEALKALGPIDAAATVCLVLQIYHDDVGSLTPKIRNPGGYLRAMVRMFRDGRSNVRYELMANIRRRKSRVTVADLNLDAEVDSCLKNLADDGAG